MQISYFSGHLLMMKKLVVPLTAFILFISCSKEEYPDLNFKQEMRDFVIGISEYSRAIDPGFIIIPQNGIELVTKNGGEDDSLHVPYLSAIDGNGQEDLFYGYDRDDKATSEKDRSYLQVYLDKSKNAGKVILVTDYCSTHTNMDNSYSQNNAAGYVSFAANERELSNIPVYPDHIIGENNNPVTSLSEIKNFLYLINCENYNSKADFINAVTSTNYDLLIMDLFFDDTIAFLPAEIDQLKVKSNGGRRLLISYMSIGEAEDYRYYWESGWYNNSPFWLDGENPHWEGNYKVRYWEPEWQNIIFGNDNSYLHKIIGAGFDGAYLDIIDAFEYYE
jgi:cysteinyl-tRNA synthetase